MSLRTRIESLATAVGQDIKLLTTSTMRKDVTLAASPGDNTLPPLWGRFIVGYPTTGNSPVLLEAWYKGGSILGSLASFWLNENGNPRAAMSKASDSAMKFVGWGTNQSVPTIVVEQRNSEGSGGRKAQWGIGATGHPLVGENLREGRHLVVVPAGTTAMDPADPSMVVYRLLS